jgi:hypothetical protein
MPLSFKLYFEGGMKCLIKENIFQPPDFSDLGHCIEYIKGKFVKYVKKVELHTVRVS